jgi:FkbM family methyltransferase
VVLLGERVAYPRVRLVDRAQVEFAVPVGTGDPIAAWLVAVGTLDERPLRLFRDLVERGARRVLDVGAHLGTFTLTAAALGADVVAVEASPLNAGLLDQALHRNGFAGSQVVNAAASDVAGELEFTVHGPWGHVARDGRDEEYERVRVPAVSLDCLLDDVGWDQPDLVKIDIEGWDPRALAGLVRRLCRDDRPTILIESNAPMLAFHGFEPSSLLPYLADHGYGLHLIDVADDHRLVAVDPADPQPEPLCDVLAHPGPLTGLDGWTVREPFTDDELIARLVACAAHDDEGFRHYAAGLLCSGPDWLRDDAEVEAARRALRLDAVGAVREAAGA